MMFVCRQTSHSAGSADASFWYLRIFALSLFLLQKCVLALNFAASLNLTWLFEHSQSRWCLYNATLAWISVVWSSGGARGLAVCGLPSRHCWFWFPVFGKTAVLHNMWHRRTDMGSLSFFFFSNQFSIWLWTTVLSGSQMALTNLWSVTPLEMHFESTDAGLSGRS